LPESEVEFERASEPEPESPPEPEPEPESAPEPDPESDPEPEPGDVSVDFEPASPPSEAIVDELPSPDRDRLAAELRSFLAQPEPLNTIVGGAKAFRTGDSPQIGQTPGPTSFTPWITSNRCPLGQR
jgi:hypothetical protein